MASFGAQHFYYDDETGEIVTYKVSDETGEPTSSVVLPRMTENVDTVVKTPNSRQEGIEFPSGYVSANKKFQSLKENIIAGSNLMSHRLLLIPTILFCFPLIAAMIMTFEIILHVICHQKNKHLNDSSMYYRSPFHLVTSAFCAVCRDCDTASKIGQLQDKRRQHHIGLQSAEFDFMRNLPVL